MRPIRFRAWDSEGKLMFHNVQNAYDTLENHLPPGIEDNYENREKYTLYDISFGRVLTGGYEVMQYTGLKDKNGKEIYEGDVVRLSYPGQVGGEAKVHQVVWNDAFVLEPRATFAYYFDENMVAAFASDDVDFQVIGNIYENPELLKNESSR